MQMICKYFIRIKFVFNSHINSRFIMPKINKEKCIDCDYCVSVCPEVFELGEDGKSKIKKDADFKKIKIV